MEWQFAVLLVGACGLGLAHAFEVDHMTAVSAFVAQKPKPREAAWFGIKWAIGHGFSLLLLGSALYALRLTLSEGVASALERLVGLALFLLGLWTLNQLRHTFLGHTHDHSHTSDETIDSKENAEHLHTHADGTMHSHAGNGSLWMGMLHGVAGTAAFVGESLVAVSQSYWKVFAFTLAFSVGVLVAMGAYAAVLGSLLNVGERRAAQIGHGARALTGVWACLVGIYWIIK